jgi:hypothetical protein
MTSSHVVLLSWLLWLQCPRFEVQPIGPLGALVSIRPELKKWRKAVEESFGPKWKRFLGAACTSPPTMHVVVRICGVRVCYSQYFLPLVLVYW